MMVSAATEVNADNAALPDQKLYRRHEKSPNVKSPKLKSGLDSPLQTLSVGIESIAPDDW